MKAAVKLMAVFVAYLVAVMAACYAATDDSTTIAAFNIQIFGTSKAKKADVMETLKKTLQRYDITLVQEIRDSSETAIYKLLYSMQTEDMDFELVISGRLGSSNTKEQYAYIYRKDKGIKVLDTYQYPEPNAKADDRTFERPPFAVKFHIPHAEVQEVALVGIHTDPDKAPEEIDALVQVHEEVKRRWKIDNVILMGDFNADCSYVSKTAQSKLKLRASGFHWLIDDNTDTTVSSTDCAYDRFVVHGESLYKNVVPNSVSVFHYDQEYGLDTKQAKDVSDHYPIVMAIKNRKGYKYSSNDESTCRSAANKLEAFGSRIKSFITGMLDEL